MKILNFNFKNFENIIIHNLTQILQKKAQELENEYKKNPYIKDAKVIFDGENIKISLELTFKPTDSENQNIIKVFEYGGILKNGDELIKIKPGYYIRRIFNA